MRYVLITGANKGIGLATVQAALEQGDDVHVFLGSRNTERGEAAKASLVEQNASWAERITVLTIDVGDDASVTASVDAVKAVLGDASLYGIVNNAGVGFGDQGMDWILNVNTRGPKRVCDAFMPLLQAEGGRVVNVASAAGPMFVARCPEEKQRAFTHAEVTWAELETLMAECVAISKAGGDFEAAGFGGGDAYGLSKAALNAYTIELARTNPAMVINACTPGFIETDMTRPFAESSGSSPEAMGMKSPAQGTKASIHLLFGEPGGSGWYFGSDAVRSPLHAYRSPGDPPYTGD